MNHDEITTPSRFFPAERLVAYQVAKEVMTEIIRLSARWPSYIKDDAARASTSAFLNVAEGGAQPRGSRLKRRHYDIALASAGEVAATIDAAAALGCSPAAELAVAKQRVARLGALIAGLVRSCHRGGRRSG